MVNPKLNLNTCTYILISTRYLYVQYLDQVWDLASCAHPNRIATDFFNAKCKMTTNLTSLINLPELIIIHYVLNKYTVPFPPKCPECTEEVKFI